MGGMQYQTEHHMFPQIPFYNLPQASKIIKEELEKLNKSMVYGPVIWLDQIKSNRYNYIIKSNIYQYFS